MKIWIDSPVFRVCDHEACGISIMQPAILELQDLPLVLPFSKLGVAAIHLQFGSG
jgi:hypothetical protein